MDSLWTRCSVATGSGLCGKPVKTPMVGALGFCEEHAAHGVCCRCGRFWLSSGRLPRVEYDGVTHTAFQCRRALSGEGEGGGR